MSTLDAMAEMLRDKDTTIQKLRELLLPARTSEKTRKVLEGGGADPAKSPRRAQTNPRKGHGRKGAAAYTGARKVGVAHPVLKRADRCPGCRKGKVYPLDRPKTLIRVIGLAPRKRRSTSWARCAATCAGR